MNPDTRLTTEQLRAICARHDVPYRHHERITTGFSHEVHRLNDDLIIKLFNAHDVIKFRTESALLASSLPFRKPKLLVACEESDDVDRSYVITSYVPGKSLGGCWHLATDEQRERLIEQICVSLKAINQINTADVDLGEIRSWSESIQQRGRRSVERLILKQAIDDDIANRALRKIEDNLPIFADSRLYPTYWDIHFDNFIVNDSFELQAIIDLENVEMAALDSPLVVIEKQTHEPKKFLNEAYEPYANTDDYRHLKGWYCKYFPEMFAFEHLDDRVNTYLLLDTLHLLEDWPLVRELHDKLNGLVE